MTAYGLRPAVAFDLITGRMTCCLAPSSVRPTRSASRCLSVTTARGQAPAATKQSTQSWSWMLVSIGSGALSWGGPCGKARMRVARHTLAHTMQEMGSQSVSSEREVPQAEESSQTGSAFGARATCTDQGAGAQHSRCSRVRPLAHCLASGPHANHVSCAVFLPCLQMPAVQQIQCSRGLMGTPLTAGASSRHRPPRL